MRFVLGVLVGAGLFFGCGKQPPAQEGASNFSVTNVVGAGGMTDTVLLFTNGIYFGFRTNMVSVDVPGRYGSWIYYGKDQAARRMIHQFYGTNRYWLTDMDADGIPDTKIDYNPGPKRGSKSIFLKGDWIEAEIRYTNASAMIDGGQKSFMFENGKWRAKE